MELFGATGLTRAQGAPLAPPWAIPRSTSTRVAGRCRVLSKRYPSAGCNSLHRPDNGRPESGLVHGTGTVRHSHSAGMSAHSDGGGFQAEDADAVVQQLSDRKVNHVGIIPL